MAIIRAPRPLDTLAYFLFSRRALSNHASAVVPGRYNPLTLYGFLRQSLSLGATRQSWVALRRGRIVGLVSVAPRLAEEAWEIDYLYLQPHPSLEQEVCLDLLRHLLKSAAKFSVMKVFLRMESGNPLIGVAQRAGFIHYTNEDIYYLRSGRFQNDKVSLLRPRRPVDDHGLFQLYNFAVPVQVRQIEGMTLEEWRWSEGWRLQPAFGPGSARTRYRRDYVLDRMESDLGLAAWIQANTRSRRLDLLIHPDETNRTETILRMALATLQPPAVLPVRVYHTHIARAAVNIGMEPIAEHALLAASAAIRMPLARQVQIPVAVSAQLCSPSSFISCNQPTEAGAGTRGYPLQPKVVTLHPSEKR